jgi:hypothetical protein
MVKMVNFMLCIIYIIKTIAAFTCMRGLLPSLEGGERGQDGVLASL